MANVQSTNAILDLVLKKHESRMESRLAAGFLPLEEITSFIIKLINCQHLTTITIDTLDEYNPQNRHELLDAISSSTRFKRTKVLISSRKDRDIVCHLEGCVSLKIEARRNQPDIFHFVETGVVALSKESDYS